MSGRRDDRHRLLILATLAMLLAWLPACDPLPAEPDSAGAPVRVESEGDDTRATGGDPGDDTDPPNTIPSGPYRFAISESDTAPNARVGVAREGLYLLYLWMVSGRGGISALEANVAVTGDTPFVPVFSAISPNLGLTLEGGSDVLLAIPGQPAGPMLLGSILIDGSGNGGTVTLVWAGEGTGAVDCNLPPILHPFSCEPYTSVPAPGSLRRVRATEPIALPQ